ncbi:MAG: VWA domain-containing protein [Lachnospiraceae bacterium]|nr:VWA domain-containing protein [Lachnospiraceae bacterium]
MGAFSLVSSLPAYRRVYRRSRILSFIYELFIISALVSTLFLMARPYETRQVKIGVQKRDIMLCLDVSYSLYALNYELADYLEEVVTQLKGDRFGITIFNTTSVVYVPLTDDYSYVVTRLEELKEYFVLQKEYNDMVGTGPYITFPTDEEWDAYYDLDGRLAYIEAGTLVNNHERGSSLIGEGLASSLYSFPSLGDESRTRIIIFATDNADAAKVPEIPNLEEAGILCRKNDVTVFAIFPSEDAYYHENTVAEYEVFKSDLRDTVRNTGGELYVQSSEDTVSKIVEEIRSHEAMSVDDIMIEQQIDIPVPWMIMLLISIAGSRLCLLFLKGK